MSKELKFKQIAVAGFQNGLWVLWGVNEDGKVYQWGGEHMGWTPLRMDSTEKE